MPSKHITRIEKDNLCGFCGTKDVQESKNFCSKKCKELDEISESIQKINFCVDLLKDKLDSKSDKKTTEIINLLEKYSFNISENIISIRNEIS